MAVILLLVLVWPRDIQSTDDEQVAQIRALNSVASALYHHHFTGG
jgi:hypothetical protein